MTKESTVPALVVIKGPTKEKLYPLETNLVTVGRGEEADIRLIGDTAISRVHLSLRVINGRYQLANISDNGTLVNDTVTETRQLQNGDRIRVGDLYLLEFADGSQSAVKAPRSSMFARPGVLIGCGVYALAMVAAAVFLSNSPASGTERVDSERVSAVLKNYGRYMSISRVSSEEQDARQRAVRGYLRAALIAEREGNYPEARRTYLRVMDYAQDGRSPIYQFALERLRALPVPEK